MELPNACLGPSPAQDYRAPHWSDTGSWVTALPASHQHQRDAQIQPSEVSQASVSCLPGGGPPFQGVWWPVPRLRRARAWQSFLDGFVIPQELYALWARGSQAETKPQGSSAAGDATRYVLAMCSLCACLLQQPGQRPHHGLGWCYELSLWPGLALSHLCGLGWCYEPSPWPRLVPSAISVAWVAAMSHLPACG